MPPTIVLVHGAFAESSSWDGVIDLVSRDHPVIAAANPLRGLAADAQAVSDLVRSVDGPVVLVAHSYGGAVISNVDADSGEIAGLVYVNGFAPEAGDTCFSLDHSYIHGGSVRTEPRSRYRQWMTHKLAHWIDQFGSSGCVGCGRCISWCPVGIDITEEAAAIRATADPQRRDADGRA